MAYKDGVETIRKILKDMSGNQYFIGDVTLLLDENFRQTLSVEPRTKNMRIHLGLMYLPETLCSVIFWE